MKKIIIPLIVVIALIILIVVVPLAWYLLSPLFTDSIVNEELPKEILIGKDMEDRITNEKMTEEMKSVDKEILSGNFMDADNFHKTKGMSKVFDIGDKRYLRFEDFETTNGPKLVVYLSTDLQASDYISLGNLKGNIGDQNYEIPNNVDLNKYDKVLIWCEPFRVLFGSSKLI